MTDFASPFALDSGGTIPAIGAGTWPLDDAEVEQMCLTAFEIGYRLVDTAENYRNEAGVGNAVRTSGLPREELFVTTKFNREWHGDAVAGVQRSLTALGLDYADLVLIHWPNPEQDLYVKAWEGLIAAREQGLVRHIGTSNFTPAHLDRVIEATGVTPALNQVQIYPYIDRATERAHHRERGIVTESWSPLGRGGQLADPTIMRLAADHGCTPGQLVLAWHHALGLLPVPKSADPGRLADNFAAVSMELSDDVVQQITALHDPTHKPADPETFGH